MLEKNNLTREELFAVEVPMQTRTYKPVSHRNIIETTLEQIDKSGFVVKDEHYISAQNGFIATGYYNLEYFADPEVNIRIAWQNSYNKQVSLKYAIGLNVMVCTNGSFYGDIGGFKKRHTGIVQEFTPAKIADYFQSAEDIFGTLVKHKNRMKEIELSKKVVAQLIGEMYITEALLKETQISIIKKEIIEESFDYGVKGTAWNIYNAVTHSFKTLHPSEYIERHSKLHTFFADKFDLQ
jgi:hypothetical protein